MIYDDSFIVGFSGMLDADSTLQYMKKMSPITIGSERRIRFINETYRSPCSKAMSHHGSHNGHAGHTKPVSASSPPAFTISLFYLTALLLSTWFVAIQ